MIQILISPWFLYLFSVISERKKIRGDICNFRLHWRKIAGANDTGDKVLTYIEYRAVSCVFRTINSPPPLHPSSVSSPRTKGGGFTLAGRWGGGGSIFRKTPDIGLASYSIIPLRHRRNSIRGLKVKYCCLPAPAGCAAWSVHLREGRRAANR